MAVTAVVVAVLLLVDLDHVNPRSPTGRLLLAEALLLPVAAWVVVRWLRAGRRGAALGLVVVVASASVLLSRFVEATVVQRQPGVTALAALLVVVAVLCRRLPLHLLPVVPVPVVAVVLLSMRLPPETASQLLGDLWGWLGLAAVAAAGWGVALRAEDGRRDAALEHVRQAERLELARDLHDDVAHHVTAMIVLAQAGEGLAERDPAHAARLFADVERAGQDGLHAMSRMVRLLRTPDGAGPRAPVVRGLDAVRELVARFAGAQLHLGAGVDERSWSPELSGTVQRLIQEGLTNVRKHAHAATTVHVRVEQEHARLVVTVRDDGARRGRSRFRGSGFGMVGLAERVSALGGELTGGPGTGGGWLLTASLPVPQGVR